MSEKHYYYNLQFYYKGGSHTFYLRPADDVTKWDLRHAITSMPSDPHPFSRPAKRLYFCMLIIEECSINLEIR